MTKAFGRVNNPIRFANLVSCQQLHMSDLGSEQRERLGKSERQLEVTQSNSGFDDRSHPGSEQRERLGSSERQLEVKNYLETMTLLGRTIRSCSM